MFLCLFDLIPDILIDMVIRNQLKPHDTNVKNVATVEENMGLHKDYIERWTYNQNEVIEVNPGDDEGSLTCLKLEPVGKTHAKSLNGESKKHDVIIKMTSSDINQLLNSIPNDPAIFGKDLNDLFR